MNAPVVTQKTVVMFHQPTRRLTRVPLLPVRVGWRADAK